jgi:predicted nucleic acid-binding protein
MSTLLDTNVLSELLRSPPAPAVLAWFAEQPPESLFVSAVTQAEMMLGARLDNGPSPCDEGPLEGRARCYLGWLMGYKTAT